MKEKKVLLGKTNEKKVSNGTGYEMDPTPYLGLFLPTCMDILYTFIHAYKRERERARERESERV